MDLLKKEQNTRHPTWEELINATETEREILLGQIRQPSLHKGLLKRAITAEKYSLARDLMDLGFPKNNQDVFLYACRNLPSPAVKMMWSNDYSVNSLWKGFHLFLENPQFSEDVYSVFIKRLSKEEATDFSHYKQILLSASKRSFSVFRSTINFVPASMRSWAIPMATQGLDENFRFAVESAKDLHESTQQTVFLEALRRNMLDLADDAFRALSEDTQKKFLESSAALLSLVKNGHVEAIVFVNNLAIAQNIKLSFARAEEAFREVMKENRDDIFHLLRALDNSSKSHEACLMASCQLGRLDYMKKSDTEENTDYQRPLMTCLSIGEEDVAVYLLKKMPTEQIDNTLKRCKAAFSGSTSENLVSRLNLFKTRAQKESLSEHLSQTVGKKKTSAPKKI